MLRETDTCGAVFAAVPHEILTVRRAVIRPQKH